MLNVLKYVICLVIVLSSNTDAQTVEENDLKVHNTLRHAEGKIRNAITLLESCDNSTSYIDGGEITVGLMDLKVLLEEVQEAKQLYPICEKSKLYEKPMDCSEVLSNGNTENGIYSIWPRSRLFGGDSISVYCDMVTDGGGWTVIQRRGNYSKQENFYQDWEQYKNGFGDKEKDFWLGNEYIHVLTNQGENEVRFDLEDVNGERGFAQYSTFWIDNEDSSYTLHISNYTGNVGDCMKHHNNMKFSTKDRGSTEYARFYKGGWWYNNWAHSNLNGRYRLGISIESVHWWYWRQNRGLSTVEMKLRPRRLF